ncbi:hypothetical protein GLOIN_2v1784863 [Rhizophagus irregularis DAOM 181602=DAOM 197198]|uniref:Uncharacterized protein n=1 Tax=Rhizophagus irregularis (strain DAOM 181602 / DAOM 197198 / MUCL 43194) TaxID=747089 RepID=A0A2P4PBK5_RHIID|nr:hypothetical protein GLOIN_2v1784863 [Rhizophagus irregularis DAOM 181602=DAOM 197198]POG62788.1 hypothetical protein GLOIN_2v1784863 [Rhizophagus irregularis DAOM 181602=DAOM 197198]|eukprot:XP_025169654.1 hypothetical protein GLOIN_2v1784863 [Rhizophagus irregularis DAOM 181602=DAOM 197198]
MSPSLSYFYPESITECQRFWVYLRKLNFLNPMETKTDFKSLGGENILHKVESLLEQMSESIRKQCNGIGSKKKSELLAILQEVRNLQSIDSELDDIDVV